MDDKETFSIAKTAIHHEFNVADIAIETLHDMFGTNSDAVNIDIDYEDASITVAYNKDTYRFEFELANTNAGENCGASIRRIGTEEKAWKAFRSASDLKYVFCRAYECLINGESLDKYHRKKYVFTATGHAEFNPDAIEGFAMDIEQDGDAWVLELTACNAYSVDDGEWRKRFDTLEDAKQYAVTAYEIFCAGYATGQDSCW